VPVNEQNSIAAKLKALDYRSVQLVFCERFNEQSSIWNFEWHRHSFFEFLYFLDGKASIHGDGNDLNIAILDAVAYPENVFHQESLDSLRHQEIICLGLKFNRPTMIDHIFSLTDYDNRLKWLFVEIHRQQKKGRTTIARRLLEVLMLYVEQYCEEGSFTPDDKMERVRQYIHSNFSRRMTIAELASIAHTSPSYLDRLFRRKLSRSPIQYVNWIRARAAAQLLVRKDLTVSHVGELVGIQDPKYFARIFRKYTGVSPSVFRSKM